MRCGSSNPVICGCSGQRWHCPGDMGSEGGRSGAVVPGWKGGPGCKRSDRYRVVVLWWCHFVRLHINNFVSVKSNARLSKTKDKMITSKRQ